MFRFNPITQKLDLTGTSGGGGGAVDTLTGNSGGPIGPDGGGNINVVGSGSVTVAGSGNTLTISDSGPFFSWSVIVANQMATTQQGYFTDGGFRVEVQLPAGSAVGDTFKVFDLGGNGWKVIQGVGQQILFGDSASTSGVTGYLQSIFVGDGVELVCCVANLTWMVVDSVGNPTVF